MRQRVIHYHYRNDRGLGEIRRTAAEIRRIDRGIKCAQSRYRVAVEALATTVPSAINVPVTECYAAADYMLY
jgi:hypothetical protein